MAAFAVVACMPTDGYAGVQAGCEGIVIETEAGSELDDGANSFARHRSFGVGVSTSWAITKRCTAGDNAVCTSDQDCDDGTCAPTCDCGIDPSCELAGPAHGSRCLNNMADCTVNADCPSSAACVKYFGPPQPVAYNDSPMCLLTHFEGPATGTYDSSSGDVSISGTVRRRYFLGETADRPCPRCGAPNQDPDVGEAFTCTGGPRNGQACVVEAVTDGFGGTSSDCPPDSFLAVGGTGTTIRFDDLTSGESVRTASLPCAVAGFTGNPTVPGSNPKCTDTPAGAVCTSNADCKRCTGNSTQGCTNNTDCIGIGTCAEAPLQPITCGYWCHCGFCNGIASKPCFETSDCSNGETCQKGTGGTGTTTFPQQRPNECQNDAFICGTEETEGCESSTTGSCTGQPFRTCAQNVDCEDFNAGTCVIQPEPCFQSRIERSGDSTPLGLQCAFEEKSCSSNADCDGAGDFCVADSSRATLAGIYCQSATTQSAINSVVGLAGPGVLSIEAFVKVCRCAGVEPGCDTICGSSSECGNGTIEGDEDCDGGPCCTGECTLRTTATVCRSAVGGCDVAESCNGTSSACPADTFSPTSTACRASAGVCDVAESCSGTSATCPANAFAPTSTSCRGSAGICDLAESCSGTSATCPGNAFAPTSTPCRGSAGVCDVAESCSGTSATCPGDAFAPTSSSCRSSAGVCDVAESCSGSTATCPGDTFAATTTPCRVSSGDCDAAETCSGTAATCPADADEPNGTTCNDGNACTNSDQCTDGSCAGMPIPECGAECGNGTVEGSEACDDGNATFTIGEYCGVACVLIPCGRPTNGSGDLPKTSDALFVLRTAVDQVECSPRVCSPDGNQTILTSDALLVLRAAVGQNVNLNCPTQ